VAKECRRFYKKGHQLIFRKIFSISVRPIFDSSHSGQRGNEYPQLVMVNRNTGEGNKYSHEPESTIAHEVGHNWYQGMMAFNETSRHFWMKGLTSFATVIYLEHYYGRRHNNFYYTKEWQRKYLPNGDERNDNQKIYIARALGMTKTP